MARRKLRGYLEEDEQERAAINTYDAKDSMDAVYEDLRERSGCKASVDDQGKASG